MLFTTAYLTGHAGSRLGWGWIEDPVIAALAQNYILTTTAGISCDSQYRLLTIFNAITNKNTGFFDLSILEMDRRWGQMQRIFTTQNKPERFTLMNKVFGGVYLWVRCNFPGDYNCTNVFLQSVGITGVGGEAFGMNSSYVRFNFAHFTFIADATTLGIQNFFFPGGN